MKPTDYMTPRKQGGSIERTAPDHRIVTLSYAGTPPSYNTFRRAHWRKEHRIFTQWKGIIEDLLTESGLERSLTNAPDRFIWAEAHLRFPTRTRRDEGNYRTPLEKPLGDALTNGGWIPDDTPHYFRFGGCHFVEERGECHTVICLAVTDRAVDEEAQRASP